VASFFEEKGETKDLIQLIKTNPMAIATESYMTMVDDEGTIYHSEDYSRSPFLFFSLPLSFFLSFFQFIFILNP
jgi:hypothetical protein